MAAEKDARTYIRIHDGMPDHPKVDGLSDAAFRLLVTTWCWCSRHLTDGRIPAGSWSKRGDEESRAELLASGLADLLDDGAVWMHDYTDHQRTAEEVQRIKEARREAGSKGGKARANAIASAKANGIANAQAKPKQNLAIDIDIVKGKTPAENPAELITDLEPGPDPFDAWWKLYPKKKDKALARAAYAAALKKSGVTPSLLLASLQNQLPTMTDLQYVIYPERWLKRERWADEVAPVQATDANQQRRHVPLQVPEWLDPNDGQGYADWVRANAS